MVTGLILLAFYLLVELAWGHEESQPFAAAVAFGCLALASVAWMLRRYVCALTLPLGILCMVVVVSRMIAAATTPSHALPSTAVRNLIEVHTIDHALFVGAFMSIVLGAYNAFPVYGQDGAVLLMMTGHRYYGDKGTAVASGFSLGLLVLILLLSSSSFLVGLLG
jgi:Zn-dependent protease